MGIRIMGNVAGENVTSCGSCGDVIYPDLRVLRDHYVENLPDGRTRLTARGVGYVVHECSWDDMSQQIVREATAAQYDVLTA